MLGSQSEVSLAGIDLHTGVDVEIDARTQLILLLGKPVRHSLSPTIHNHAFRELGLPLIYVAAEVSPENLADAVAGMRALGVVGANVTVPHKSAVLSLLDHIDERADRIGAVNTIVNSNGRLVGYNTDVDGFLSALDAVWGGEVGKTAALLVGAGGAARAVAAGLAGRGIKELRIWNRTTAKAAALCRQAEAWGARSCQVVDAITASQCGEVDLVIQASSFGLEEDVKHPLIPVDIFRRDVFLMDLQYGQSPLVGAASARGLRAVDGLEMLVRQAAASFELWTGLKAPEHTMRAAAAPGHSD